MSENWTPRTWQPGDPIKAEYMNNIEDQINAITNEIIDARNYGEGQSGSLGSRIDNMIIYSNNEPTSADNELWIQPQNTSIQVPTYEEFENEVNKRLALDYTDGTLVTDGTDYNSLITPGSYYVYSGSNAATMTNCPTTAAHRLTVMSLYSAARPIQIIQTVDNLVFMRVNGGSWGSWKKFADTKIVEDEINKLKNIIIYNSTDIYAERGQLSSSDGTTSSSTTRLRTGFLPRGTYSVGCESGYQYMLFAYQVDGTYVGVWNGTAFAKSGSWKTSETVLIIPDKTYLYRIVFAYTTSNTDIVASAISNLNVKTYTDSTFNTSGYAADAGAIGKYFEPYSKYGPVDALYLLDKYGEATYESKGVTFISHGDGTWDVSGTATDNGFCELVLHKPIIPGVYYLDFHGGTIPFKIYIEYTSSPDDPLNYTTNSYVNIPSNANTITARFITTSGTTYNATNIRYTLIRVAEPEYFIKGCIESTGDTTDRTAEIEFYLNNLGYCHLKGGTYYTSGIKMPDNSFLFGEGNSTILQLNTVNDGNKWTFGNQTFTQYVAKTYDSAIPAGYYRLSANISSNDTDATTCAVMIYRASPYNSNNRIVAFTMSRTQGASHVFYAPEPFVGIELYASNNYSRSSGDSATFSNISLEMFRTAIILGSSCSVKDMQIQGASSDIELPATDGLRYGIGYYGIGTESTIKNGEIHNCYLHGFSGGGIHFYNTGYPVTGISVSDCLLVNNYCGIYIQHFSEFHKFVNCNARNNVHGVINNGGNNTFANCSMSANQYGFTMDNSEDNHNNTAHGEVVGCLLQHNRVNAVYINNTHSGFIFSGCNIDDSGANIIDSERIIFTGCNFMSTFTIDVSGGGLVMFIGSNMRDYTAEHTTITNNNAVKFINCYNETGTEINPIN